MSQTPGGTLTLRSAAGDAAIRLEHQNYCVPGILAFHAAVRGAARPASSGEDGLIALATALAGLESAREGRSIAIKLDG